MRGLVGIGLVSVMACGPGSKDTGTQGTQGATDTSVELPFTPVAYAVAAAVGYDASTGSLASYGWDGVDYPCEVVVTVLDARGVDGDPDYTCTVTYTFEAAEPASWVAGSDAVVGGDVPFDAQVVSTCPEGVEPLSPLSVGWGAMDAGLLAEVQTAIEEAGLDWAADWEPFVLAGGVAPSGVWEASAYGFAYAADDDLVATFDGGQVVTYSTAEALAGPTGVYELYSFWLQDW